MGRAKRKSSPDRPNENSQEVQGKRVKQIKIKKTKSQNPKTKEFQVKRKKTRTRSQQSKLAKLTRSKKTKDQVLEQPVHVDGTRTVDDTSAYKDGTTTQDAPSHDHTRDSSTTQMFVPEIFSTQLESDNNKCVIPVIDVTPTGNIVVLDSNNASVKIYDASFQHLSLYKWPPTKMKYWVKYDIDTMAVLTNEEVMMCVFGGTKTLGTSFNIMDIGGKKTSIIHTSYRPDIEVKAMAVSQNKIFIAGVYTKQHKPPFVNQIDRCGKIIWDNNLTNSRHEGHPKRILMCCMEKNDQLNVLVVDSNHASRIRNYDGNDGKFTFDFYIEHKGDILGITFGNNNLHVCFPEARTIDVYNTGFELLKTVKFGGDPPLCIKYSEFHELMFVANTGAYPHVIDKMRIQEL